MVETMHQLAVRPVLSLPVRLRADMRAKGAGIGIAMIDSDFVAHPDLMFPTNRILKYVDAVENEVHDKPPTKTTKARQWHGTMTACTAAGNGYLSQGVFSSLAPRSTVVLIRTMNDEGRVTTDTIVRALRYVRDHAAKLGIRVVNISVYDDALDQTTKHPVNAMVESLVERGIVVIAAVGNNPNVPIRPPASSPSGIAVGGLDDKNSLIEDDREMYHSTFGITKIGVQKPDLIAPAIYLPAPILTGTPQHDEASALCALDAMTDEMLMQCAATLLPATELPMSSWTSRDTTSLRKGIRERISHELIASPYYKMVDGTSFSAPIVASVVAQMLEIDPELEPADVKRILKETATPMDNVSPLVQGAGIVNQRIALASTRDRDPVQ
jgi:serine protease AprX